VRPSRLVAVVAAGAVVLSACSDDAESVVSDSVADDVLIAAVSAQPDTLDPHRTSAYPSFQVLENVYDTLVVPNAEDLTMEPSLAESWTTSEDGLTWTFTLRDGVLFHDGSTFDSADVVYSYDRIIDEDLANASRFATVASVEAPDARTVVLRLSRPTPNLLALIGAFKGMAILPEGAAEAVEAIENNRAGVGFLKGGDRAHQRRLARAVRAEEAEELARGDHEIDGVECEQAIVVALCQALELEGRRGEEHTSHGTHAGR